MVVNGGGGTSKIRSATLLLIFASVFVNSFFRPFFAVETAVETNGSIAPAEKTASTTTSSSSRPRPSDNDAVKTAKRETRVQTEPVPRRTDNVTSPPHVDPALKRRKAGGGGDDGGNDGGEDVAVECSLKDFYDQEELLRRLKLGKFIGRGLLMYTAEAYFDPLLNEIPMPSSCNNNSGHSMMMLGDETHTTFVAKITGIWKRPEQLMKTHSPIEQALLTVELTDRLQPHPSIPRILHHFHNIPNPFLDGADPHIDFWLKDDYKDQKEKRQPAREDRVLEVERVSISLMERVVKTHEIFKTSDEILDIPLQHLRCFWRQLFEVSDYIHSRGVMINDLELRNILLQDGIIKFFDFNMGEIFSNSSNTAKQKKFGHVYPPEFEYKFLHERDAEYIGYHIRQHLSEEVQKELSSKDVELLLDIRDQLESDEPPTMGWFLENHEYFAIEEQASCNLVW